MILEDIGGVTHAVDLSSCIALVLLTVCVF